MRELWKPVVGYEGLYEVSNRGNVRTLQRSKRGRTGRLMRLQSRPDYPYLMVMLHKNGRRKNVCVHKIVGLAWLGPCPEGLVCDHKNDSEQKNNRTSNLQYITKQQNSQKAYAAGRMHPPRMCGTRHPGSKLTDTSVREIRKRRADGEGIVPLGEAFGVSDVLISRICKRRAWAHVK